MYKDNDGDGFGAGSPVACGVASNTDCNDDASVHTSITYYKDNDRDGFGAGLPVAYGMTNSTDCNNALLTSLVEILPKLGGQLYLHAL